MSMIFNGIAGMTVASRSLMVTSSNIANASVVGYSRQKAFYGVSSTGTVYVDSVKRISNQFYVSQGNKASTTLGHATTMASQSGMLETTLSNESMSLSPALSGFFGSLDRAQANPMDKAYRQEVLGSSRNLASRYNGLKSGMTKQLNEMNKQVDVKVNEANSAMKRLAGLNREIQQAEAAGGASPTLLDERDKAVKHLSELMGVEAHYQPDNTVNLTTPSGEALVIGSTANELVVQKDGGSWNHNLALKTQNHTKPLKNAGGALQGQLDFRENVLKPAKDDLNKIGKVLAREVNNILTQGFDLKGEKGKALFEYSEKDGLKVLIEDPEKLAFSSNPKEPGNNDVLKKLGELRHKKIKDLDNQSLKDSYNSLVIRVGSQKAESMNKYRAASLIQQEANNKIASVSGVNMDEEAANLMVFQQSYAANARVISAANEMLNTLLRL